MCVGHRGQGAVPVRGHSQRLGVPPEKHQVCGRRLQRLARTACDTWIMMLSTRAIEPVTPPRSSANPPANPCASLTCPCCNF